MHSAVAEEMTKMLILSKINVKAGRGFRKKGVARSYLKCSVKSRLLLLMFSLE